MCILCSGGVPRRWWLRAAGTWAAAAAAPARADEPAMPEGAASRAALRLARDAMPPFLLNHGLRTYAFGLLLARRHGREVDREVLFAAAVLHDLGLVAAHMSPDGRFEVDSADAARRLLLAEGVDEARAQRTWEAIAFHSSPGIAPRLAPEVAFTHLGAGMDVFGRGTDALGRDEVAAVLAAHPRQGFDAGFRALVVEYARRKPLAQLFTWTDQLARAAGVSAPTYDGLLAASPFAEARP